MDSLDLRVPNQPMDFFTWFICISSRMTSLWVSACHNPTFFDVRNLQATASAANLLHSNVEHMQAMRPRL